MPRTHASHASFFAHYLFFFSAQMTGSFFLPNFCRSRVPFYLKKEKEKETTSDTFVFTFVNSNVA
jgi:hypothetical protein